LTTGRDAYTEMEQVAVRMEGTGKGFSSLEKKERKRTKLGSVENFT